MENQNGLTVDEVVQASNKKVLAAALGLPPVRIEVDVPDGLPGAEPTDDERVSVGVNHVNIVRVSLVQPHVSCVALHQTRLERLKPQTLLQESYLKERSCRVETCDSAQVRHLLPDEAGDVGAEGEADQVGVVVDVHTIRVDLVNHGRDLKASQKVSISSTQNEVLETR